MTTAMTGGEGFGSDPAGGVGCTTNHITVAPRGDAALMLESRSEAGRQDSGFRIQDSGFRIQDSEFRIQNSRLPE
jgi:hypothetical protein